MRKFVVGLLLTLIVALVGCVTINVYFPEAAAQKAADQFIGNVIDAAGPNKSAPTKPAPAPAPAAKTSGQPPLAMLLDLLIPTATAADVPDIQIQTSASAAINARMRERFQGVLGGLLDSGAVGFTQDGLVAMRDAASVPLSQRAEASTTIADENRDRLALYHEVATANGHPQWAAQIQATFAKGWIERAKAGWYVQNAAGAWQRK